MLDSLKRFLRLPLHLSSLETTWLFAPFAVWLSYHPLVQLGRNATMYFELSVTVLFVALLALMSVPIVWRNRRRLMQDKRFLPVSIFVVINGISLAWSVDPLRGFMTFGLLGTLYLVFLGSICEMRKLAQLIPALTKLLIISALLISVLALVQMIAGIWIDQNTALLCRGCTAQQFGFVRPNVFAIEPQFLGNLLLAPGLILLHFFINQNHRYKYTGWALFFVTTTLLLTLSRGAIFAFAIGALVMLVVELRSTKIFGRITALFVSAFVACLLWQASLAAMHPKLDTSFIQAIRVSVNQLSMGVITLPSPPESTAQEPNQPRQATESVKEPTRKTAEKAPNFDGYVEESTNTRLELSSLSFQLWHESLPRAIFGVGVGGSGQALRDRFPNKIGQREIVQNEYVEILLENGLLGITIFGSIIALLLFVLRRSKWLWSVVVAFLVQWNFFSGYPNALHIYLILILCSIYALYPLKQTLAKSPKPTT